MTYLVDTDWVAEYLKGREPAVRTIPRLSADGLAISIITYGEIYEGIYYGRDPETHERGFRLFLRSVEVLPLNRSVMKRFARVRGELRRTGQIIGDPDILIGATALERNLTLLTHNRRHFERIPGLTLYREEPAS
jgi:tRNA(fMet)-specific endonuclease VapC